MVLGIRGTGHGQARRSARGGWVSFQSDFGWREWEYWIALTLGWIRSGPQCMEADSLASAASEIRFHCQSSGIRDAEQNIGSRLLNMKLFFALFHRRGEG